jgi:membrane protein DedA with SNARE-associated domain
VRGILFRSGERCRTRQRRRRYHRGRRRLVNHVPDRRRLRHNALLPSGCSRTVLRGADPRSKGPILDVLHDFITTAIGDYGLAAIFVLMVLESACVPIPSEVTMLFGGAMTATAFAGPGAELGFWAVVLVGTVGNLVGSWLAYWAGDRGGRPLIDRFGRYLLIRPHEVDKAHAWFERRGEVTVFVSRLLPVVRTFISLPAGVAEMPFWRFTVYTVLGCLPWCFVLTWLGAQLGDNWKTVEEIMRPIAWLIAAVLLGAAIVVIRRRWTQVRAEYAALDAAKQRGADDPR